MTINLDTRLDALPFSTRVQNAFVYWRNGHDDNDWTTLKTVADVIGKTISDFHRQPNIGDRSIREVRTVLAQCGFSLAGEPDLSIAAQMKRAEVTVEKLEPILADFLNGTASLMIRKNGSDCWTVRIVRDEQ